MNKDRQKYISRLIREFMDGDYPSATGQKVQGWYCDDRSREDKDAALREYYDALPTVDSEYSRITFAEMLERLDLADGRRTRKALRRRRLMRVAAVVVPLMILAGVAFLTIDRPGRDVQPETVCMMVTDGVCREVTLPDGSHVRLNNGASIEYPAEFGATRDVTLRGEAYFKVARDTERPFTVTTDALSIVVLGTEFNVSAPEDAEKTVVTLTSGSVEVAAGTEKVVLKPSEQLEYDHRTAAATVSEADPATYDWLSAKMNFDRTPLSNILNTLGGYYAVEVNNGLPAEYDEPISIRFSGDEPLHLVLEMLSDISEKFAYTIDEGRITIEPIN